MKKRYIIPVFIPHYGCNFQCIFCNQQHITGKMTLVNEDEVQLIIEEHLKRITEPRFIEVAFYGGSFTALPLDVQNSLLSPAKNALQKGRIQSIRISTRPDAISANIAEFLIKNHVSTVELGIQSLDDKVLEAANRGHSVEDAQNAAGILRTYNFSWGIQLMPGLPQEDWNSLLLSGNRAVQLRPHFARIYPAIVIKHTVLEDQFRAKQYIPLSTEEAVRKSAFLKVLFSRKNISVIRMGLQATEELDRRDVVVAGPYHPAFGEMVDGFIFSQIILQALEQIPYYPHLNIICHFRDESKIRGRGNSNLRYIANRTGRQIKLIPQGVCQGQISIVQKGYTYTVNC